MNLTVCMQMFMPSMITIGGVILISLFCCYSQNYSIDEKMKLFVEQFHLNSASVFLGYMAFDFHRTFVVAMIMSMICFFLEHEFFYSIFEKKIKNAYLVAFIFVVIMHVICIFLLVKEG